MTTECAVLTVLERGMARLAAGGTCWLDHVWLRDLCIVACRVADGDEAMDELAAGASDAPSSAGTVR